MIDLPKIWQDTDCFPIGPRQYVCNGLPGADTLCVRLAHTLGLTPYDTTYWRVYRGQPSRQSDPRAELLRADDGTARVEIYPAGGATPAVTVSVRFVDLAEATRLRYGARCPDCGGRHQANPCPWRVYVAGSTLISR
jgi:hypothetical protein